MPGIGVPGEERIPNHLRRLWQKGMIVSAEENCMAMTE
jgi:hypothetical protein